MSNEIDVALASLNERDMAKVERLILKLAGQKQRTPQPEKSRVDKSPSQPKVKSTRSTPQKGKLKSRNFCRKEAIDTSGGRPNEFLNSIDARSKNKDREVDKKLNQYEPTPRLGRSSSFEMECIECGQVDSITTDLLRVDPDTHQKIYRCNTCEVRRFKRGR